MTTKKVERRLAAVLSADVVGYSRMMEADESGTLARLNSCRHDIVDPSITGHNGRIVKTTGDGVLVEFASVVDAAHAAMEIQQAMAERNAAQSEDVRMVLRIGINVGDIIIELDDIHGDGVNLAVRIQEVSEPGGFAISGEAYGHVKGRLDAKFADAGEQKLKNIARPIHVWRWIKETEDGDPGVASVDVSVPVPGLGGRPAIAVLPFENMSGDPEQEFFADGITEDIITELSRFRDLLVIARNSTFQFKGRAVDVTQVGRKLHARYVVEGSVRRAMNRVRITAQLIEVASGTHLWADKYDRDLQDIFAVQDEVTRTVAATLGVRVQGAALERALRKNPSDLDAYDCVLRARRYTRLLSEEEHGSARELLHKAIELDPRYGEAYALLANVYLAEHRFGSNPLPDPVERAREMAQRAIQLDPQNAYAHCWLAVVHFFRRETERFEAEAELALRLNPNDPETLADIGHYYAFLGQFERGTDLTRQAMALNPLHPGWYHFSFARYHYDQRDYEAVVADVQKTNMPHFYWTHLLEAAALGQLGQTERAARSLARLQKIKPDFEADAELHKWNAAPSDLAHIIEGLRKAGLKER